LADSLAFTHPEQRSQDKRSAVKALVEKSCLCCCKKFKPKKSWQDFCQPECKLISWCAHKFFEAYQAGQADGLKSLIKKLSEVKR
jgi:hypothetical protein